MNQRANFYQSKFSIWLYVSLYYTLLYLPCFSTMIQQFSSSSSSSSSAQEGMINMNNKNYWGKVSNFGLYISCIGLCLESIADLQKSIYKQKLKKHPKPQQSWCNKGIWKYNTHPNYIGEVLFWLGAYISGISSLKEYKILFVGSTIGIFIMLFIMKTAYDQLNIVQYKTYGSKDNNNNINNGDDTDNNYILYKEKCESLLGYMQFSFIVILYSIIFGFGIKFFVNIYNG